ncbi:hypothetical protein AAFX91_40605 [Bradyrhizobium sp. 31Argb]|uniref:glycine-rich domain-containing protein n=1 Tax=Bradyrhizobium sp. 31Argb TaxID=3141247 RepID=UPI0037481AB7
MNQKSSLRKILQFVSKVSTANTYLAIAPNTNQAPPNATYWLVLSEKGEMGDTGPAAWSPPTAWVTTTAYTAGPPASAVVQAGETYVCLASHTSGTFATDLAAGKWIKVAQKGSGDLSSANNLSDVANAALARGNIGAIGVVKVQKFTTSGTYTPSVGMLYCIIECVGGGGGGGGAVGASGQYFSGGGGGSGGYSRLMATASAIGASKTVTVGAGGAGGPGSENGIAGGTTSVGTLCVANGGAGGFSGNGSQVGFGGNGGAPGTGDVAAAGAPGASGMYSTSQTIKTPNGAGGSSFFGGGGMGNTANGNAANGNAARNYGSGGGAAASDTTVAAVTGGGGSSGFAIITEFCTQ